VPVEVIGEPATEIRPPVKDWATLVTVPLVAGAVDVHVVPLDVSTLPDEPTAVKFVPPFATGSAVPE